MGSWRASGSQGRPPCPFHLSLVRNTWSAVSSSAQEGKRATGEVPAEVTKVRSGLQPFSFEERLWELDMDSLDKTENRSLMHKNISKGGAKRMVPDCLVVPSDRTRSNGHKIKHKKLHLNMRKNFFSLRVADNWNRLPRKGVKSPSLETIQIPLDEFLCHLLWVILPWQGGLTK